MANPKNSSDFNELAKNSGPYIGYDELKVPAERGPNANLESQRYAPGFPDRDPMFARTVEVTRDELAAKYRQPWQVAADAAQASQAAASGQAQHGVDLGSGGKTAGQTSGGKAISDWWRSMDKPAGVDEWNREFTITPDEASGKRLAESVLKIQDQRRREIAQREMVAKQQSALLDAMAAEAVAPEHEKLAAAGSMAGGFAPTHDVTLGRQVRWLIERGQTHARQIANLSAQVSQLQARCKDLEHVIANAFPARPVGYHGNGLDSCVSIGPSVVAPEYEYRGKHVQLSIRDDAVNGNQDDHVALCKAAMAKAMDQQQGAHPDCEHDLLKPNTTVSAITRKKARCNICAQVWESA